MPRAAATPSLAEGHSGRFEWFDYSRKITPSFRYTVHKDSWSEKEVCEKSISGARLHLKLYCGWISRQYWRVAQSFNVQWFVAIYSCTLIFPGSHILFDWTLILLILFLSKPKDIIWFAPRLSGRKVTRWESIIAPEHNDNLLLLPSYSSLLLFEVQMLHSIVTLLAMRQNREPNIFIAAPGFLLTLDLKLTWT